MRTEETVAGEAERLAALRSLNLLDTPREERFDRITRLAARLLQVPVVILSLVDDHRAWFKSTIGLDRSEAPRERSLCEMALPASDLLVIPDTRLDPRCTGFPCVTDDPPVVFYAGRPLRGPSGHPVGVLCVVDGRPRTLSEADRSLLRDLGCWVEAEIAAADLGRAYAQVRQAEAQIQEVLDHLLDGVLMIDDEDRVEFCSTSAGHIFGGACELLIGSRIQEILPEFERAAGSGTREIPGRRRNGERFPAEVTVQETRARGRTRWVVLARDITQRRSAEAALRESEVRLRALVEEQRLLLTHARDFVYRHDTSGVFTYISPSVEQITGRTPQEWLRHYASYMTDHPENAHVFRYTEETLRTGKQSPSYLVEIFHRDGRRVMLEVNEHAYYEEGRIAGIIGVARDVTERHHVQEALRRSEQRYADVVRESPDPILSLDPLLRVTSFNPAAERLSGYAAREVLGAAFDSAVPLSAASVERAREELRRVLGGEDRPPFEVGWEARGRGPLVLEANAHPIRHGTETVGLQVTLRDATERKRMEQRKDEFTATVSHELRTPLTSILGSLGLIAGGAAGHLQEGSKRLIDIALRNGERLLRLINDILDLDRLKTGKLELRPRALEVGRVLEQAVETDRAFADRFGVRFELEAPEPGLRVHADPDRLVQVLSNLLSNAVKFSPRGAAVRVAAERAGGAVCLSIQDRGPGIPPDFQPHVFERFAQADTSDRRVRGGSGLGLSIAKGLVEHMGGSLAFVSREGEGTTFTLRLPEWREEPV